MVPSCTSQSPPAAHLGLPLTITVDIAILIVGFDSTAMIVAEPGAHAHASSHHGVIIREHLTLAYSSA
jgi:hypothetical protein